MPPETALADSPLLAAPAHLDQAAVIQSRETWTWRQIHEAAMALSLRLTDVSAVCNLCASRVGFLITCLAAWRNRCLLVLPPSGGNADIAAVLNASALPLVVGDSEDAPEFGRNDWTYLRFVPESKPGSATAEELAWQPAWDDIAVLFHTSGSTGTPEPQPKSLRHLGQGALVLGARLNEEIDGGVAAIDRLVCSVPPQHMFGFECSVMLPLLHAIPVVDRRPLLPADVLAACADSPRPAWIATPLHLRSLVQTVETGPSCSVVITSTMPLTETVARRSERLCDAPVLEIYGATETGALAMRRTARDALWRPMAGVRLEAGDSATVAWGSHFASPMALPDALKIDANGAFALLGRQSDLIKIAGRRASLDGLNLLLEDMPGLEDGVFYLPAAGGPVERPCLIYSGAPLDRAAAQRWLRERLDPVFLPRAFIWLERLPRSETGKLRRQALDQAFAQWLSAGQPQARLADPRPTTSSRPGRPGLRPA
jgi:acyl-coenzyme A synthetase/AMP-(fatty) acid ligase